MRLTAPVPARRARHRRSTPTARRRPQRAARDERGSASSLELMALTPMLALGVLFILWAGRGARAELVTSLAAQEAAVAAAVCCVHGHTTEAGSLDDAQRRELMAATVLGARPGLDYLCADGPRPARGAAGFVTAAHVDLKQPSSAAEHAERVEIVTTHVTCEADGATAPVRGLFGTRTAHGYGAHVLVRTGAPEPTGNTPDGLGGSEQQ
ncbi:hypothetical protein [Candidatus Poriferisodalis sp.]|uniref:hypothetical protein n=1 Tax=Candidatus Poriferisodalis sp. TaxID=3101277 RepID=UPI003B58E2D7